MNTSVSRSAPPAGRQPDRQKATVPESGHAQHQTQQQLMLEIVGAASDRIGHDLLGFTVPLRAALEVAAESGIDVATAPEACRLIERLGAALQMIGASERMSMTAELTAVYETMQPLLKATLPRGVQLVAELGEPDATINAGREALSQALFRCCQVVGARAEPGDRVVVRRDRAAEPGHMELRFTLETRNEQRPAGADVAGKLLPQPGDPMLRALGASIEHADEPAGAAILLTIPLSH